MDSIDFEALVRARATLREEAERRYDGADQRLVGARNDGIIYQQCQVAEQAIFQALNVLCAYGDDPGARRYVHATEWPSLARDAP